MTRRQRYRLQVVSAVAAVVLIGWFLVAIAAPADFPVNKEVTIADGTSLGVIAAQLQEQKVIKSALTFRVLLRLSGGEKSIQAGDYWFEAPLSAWRIVGRIRHGQFVLHPIKLTIPEGSNISLIKKLISAKLPDLKIGEITDPGQIFPDTYFVPPQITWAKFLDLAQRNFTRQTASLRAAVVISGRRWEDVITLASLVEEEASNTETRHIIAGILWKRLDAEMPLQVDVARETYKKLGLPTAAISNPSLDALDAAVHPVDSEYWYYLADKQGETHYAVTFDEHKKNKRKYL